MYDSNFDGQRLMFHPAAVAEWLSHGNSRGPLYTEMGLSTRCNCRCTFCGVDHLVNKATEDLDTGVAERIIDELETLGNRALMFAGHGESLLHPDAGDIIVAASRRMSTSITTNGSHLDDAMLPMIDGLKWIRFSVNGYDDENYGAIHCTSKNAFAQVMGNIEHAVERKKSLGLGVVIGVQLVLLDENAEGVVPLARRLKSMGVSYFSVKPFSQHPMSTCRMAPDYQRWGYLEDELGALQTDSFKVIYRAASIARVQGNKRYRHCHGTNFLGFISANGDVWECNVFAGDPRFLIGNVHTESLSEMWRGRRRRQVLEFIRHDLDLDTECRNVCRMDACNCYLDRLVDPLDHDDFI